jgi:hypothetical protein
MTLSRRDTLKLSALMPAAALPSGVWAAGAPTPAPVALHWLEGAPPMDLGQTLGVAWPRGALPRGAAFAVQAGAAPLPAQSWVTATWPDGSIKWTAHALPVGPGAAPDGLRVIPAARPAAPVERVVVERAPDGLRLTCGGVVWDFAASGPALIRSASIGGRPVLGPLTLVGAMADGPDGPRTPFTGTVTRLTVEQDGPIRAVIKVEGLHRPGQQATLPFTLRFYAHAGAQHLRIVHSVIYDGRPEHDAIAGLGLSAAVPMHDAPHDRHIRLATDGALFAEAVRPLTGLRRDPGAAFRHAQTQGQPVPPLGQMSAAVRNGLPYIPTWSDFRLEQTSAHGYTIEKRTGAGHAWVAAQEGGRAPGLAYVGGASGGAAIARRWFWQTFPSALAVDHAATDTATLTAWLWSPRAEPMDLRPWRGVNGMESYDAQNAGLDITYEDYEPGWDSATGIARTSELTLWACAATPANDAIIAMAQANATAPRLMADPAALHGAQVFGDWSLPDRSGPNRAAIEDQLAHLVDFYAGEVDRRSWYGFWNFGDIMHTYDADRHVWRYDIGGFAWDNSELSPDLWLWTQALRTGAAQPWRLAEAMTRHTSEVDTYHMGRFIGLGTRHGVQHWGDSSKQPRVSNAIYRRIYYYLTADERVGDLIADMATSDRTLDHVDIGRKVPGAKAYKGPPGTFDMGFGPSWTAVAGSWLTMWERTGEAQWRDWLVAGMSSIAALKFGWMAGGAPYDPRTHRFSGPGDDINLSHLSAVFGAVEVNAELIQLIDLPAYKRVWVDFCQWFNAPKDEFLAKFGPPFGARNLREAYSRMTAYAARATGSKALMARAVEEFYSGDQGLGTWDHDPRHMVDGVLEWPQLSTNAAAQWGLAAIQLLALAPAGLEAQRIPPHHASAQEPRH